MGQAVSGWYTWVVSNKSQIGVRVRAFRLDRGLTQEQLAELIDRSVETVSNLERGVTVPSEATIARLAHCLNISVDDLLVDRQAQPAARPIEFFQAVELLKGLDGKKLKLAYDILKSIAQS